MSTRLRKRRKIGLAADADTKTLFHFFSNPSSIGSAVGNAPAQKSESYIETVHDQSRQNGAESLSATLVAAKIVLTPPQISADDGSIKRDTGSMEFDATLTPNDSCSPIKEEEDDIDPFEGLDLWDDDLQDGRLLDGEFEFPYEGSDDNEDNINDNKQNVDQELTDSAVDESPSCPFCTFSFKGLSENVSPVR